MEELPDEIWAALEAGQPPDFAFGFWLDGYARAVGLRGSARRSLGRHRPLFGPVRSGSRSTGPRCSTRTTGQKALYGLPMGQITHLHPRLEEPPGAGGFHPRGHPQESGKRSGRSGATRCSRPCARPRGATTSGASGFRCRSKRLIPAMQFGQFLIAYEADYVTPDGRLVIDDPEIRQRLVKAIDSYTAIYRKGCTPPNSVTWADIGNNKAFLAQSVVMTPNQSLSIPNALKSERPEDYYKNTATIEWPLGPSASPFRSSRAVHFGMAFNDGANVATAKEFVRFLVSRGLARALSQLFRRAHAAVDTEAARPAVLARSERPAPHGRGDAGRIATAGARLRHRLGRSAARPDRERGCLAARRSTASSPRASAPSRRSTRRSPGSSRS